MGRRCSSPSSASVDGSESNSCIPGCSERDSAHEPLWCSTRFVPPYHWPDFERGWCPWPPGSLRQMLEQHEASWRNYTYPNVRCGQPSCFYNEVILSAEAWVRHLPATIEAVFFMAASVGTEHEARARAVHRALVRQYGQAVAAVPLVEMNLSRLDRPFELAGSRGDG